jgi:quercetin dioxygenase-like cupin family protein
LHTHPHEHEVFVLNGTGIAISDAGETPISPESIAFVPGNENHCFKNTGKETLRFICVIPFTD